jgi:uncharacterized membrane protein
MATHFNASGIADGWSTREVFFLIYFSSLLLIYGCLVFARIMSRSAKYLSIPNKDKLSPEQLEYFKSFMTYMLHSMGVLTAVLIIFVMQLCINANLSSASPSLSGAFWRGFIPYILFTVVWTVVVIKKSFSLSRETNVSK